MNKIEEENTINRYYNSLSKNEQKTFRLKVMNLLMIEYSQIYYRIRHNGWTALERKILKDKFKINEN